MAVRRKAKTFVGESKRRAATQFADPDPEEAMIAENQELAAEEEEEPQKIKRSQMHFLKTEEKDELELKAELGEIEIIEDRDVGSVEPPTPSLEQFRTSELKSLISKLTLARTQAERVKLGASASINTLEFLLQARDIGEEVLDQAVPPLQFLSFRVKALDEDSTILSELAATISVLTSTICGLLGSSQEDGEED